MFDVTRGMADHTVQNNGGEDELASRVAELWNELKLAHNLAQAKALYF